MTNKERQIKLDKVKWIRSELCGEDLSGKMEYCKFCNYQGYGCTKSQQEREVLSLCAIAYNKMDKAKR